MKSVFAKIVRVSMFAVAVFSASSSFATHVLQEWGPKESLVEFDKMVKLHREEVKQNIKMQFRQVEVIEDSRNGNASYRRGDMICRRERNRGYAYKDSYVPFRYSCAVSNPGVEFVPEDESPQFSRPMKHRAGR